MDFFSTKIQKFFESIAKYLQVSGSDAAFSWLFIIFMGVFALTSIIIIFATFFSYEFVLTRAIDKINKFLSKNPRINEDNLVTFNNKMKERKVPKPLRRQWQQFMIYREHEASYYMSFKHCVENPLKTSTYHQQMSVYKRISIILVCLSVLLGVFCSYEDFSMAMQQVLIIPVFILVLYWLITLILNLVHNATTADLYQNYQYFEINIDKATTTLPEYVDYEVLFTHEEIRRGIPVLFEYIQKRAIEEQKELEKARIKNVEHEKFNFDETGLDASLVLERSMKEAEDYIATRKKYRQDIEQVNNEIAAIDNQYKDNVKENQKLMQTSKESVDGLKKQLEQATSTIEINYIKKQMKDEINRQQVAERDFDALTDKHNKEVKNLQEEIKRLEGEIETAKKALETSMMSEFGTYSTKIYKLVEDRVNAEQKAIIEGYENRVHELEEKLSQKDEELDNVYSQYQSQLSELEQKSKNFDNMLKEKDDIISQVQGALDGKSTRSKSKKRLEQAELQNYNYETATPVKTASQIEESPIEMTQQDEQQYSYFDDNDSAEQYYQEPASVEEVQDNVEDSFNYYETPQDVNYTDEDDQEDQGMLVKPQDEEEFDYLGGNQSNDQSFDYHNDETFNYTQDAQSNDNSETFDYLGLGNNDENSNNGEDFNYLADESAFERFNMSTESPAREDENSTKESKDDDNEEFSFNYLPSEYQKEDESEHEKEISTVDTDNDSVNENGDDGKQEESNDLDDKALNDLFDSWMSAEKSEDNSSESEETESFDEEVESVGEETADDELNDLFDKWINSSNEDEDEGANPVDETREEEQEDEVVTPAPKRKAGRPRKAESKGKIDFNFLVNGDEDEEEQVEEEPVEEEIVKPAPRKAGRPRKSEAKEKIDFAFLVDGAEDEEAEPVEIVEEKKPARRGRPRKVVETVATPVTTRRPGRPRKVVEEKETKPTTAKRSVGRPRKVTSEPVKRSAGRPRKVETTSTSTTKKSVGRPKKSNPVGRPKKARPVGRPRKTASVSKQTRNINEIDKKLKELNKQIKKENATIAKTKKQLANANIKKSKR